MIEKFLISGYTKRKSKGIYSVKLDTDKEELSDLTEIAEINGPTYLTTDNLGHLYSVAADGEGNGGVAAFDFDGEKAKLINSVLSPGASNCYIAVDEERGFIYSANYHLGEVRVYQRLSDGSLKIVETIKHEDHQGPLPAQTGSLCHFANLTPDNRLVVCDLGNDSIYTYNISENGELKEHAVYHSQAGSGNRHIVFSSDGTKAYLACELDSTFEVLAYEDGKFKLLQKASTLPQEHTGFNAVAAIRLSPDGNFLYISNRGNDSIMIGKVVMDGAGILILSWVSTEGEIPRDFSFSKSGKFVVVANQDSDNLTLFKYEKYTGHLLLLQRDFYCPEATCVLPI